MITMIKMNKISMKTMKMMAVISASFRTWMEMIMKKSSVTGITMRQMMMRERGKKMRTMRDCSCLTISTHRSSLTKTRPN